MFHFSIRFVPFTVYEWCFSEWNGSAWPWFLGAIVICPFIVFVKMKFSVELLTSYSNHCPIRSDRAQWNKINFLTENQLENAKSCILRFGHIDFILLTHFSLQPHTHTQFELSFSHWRFNDVPMGSVSKTTSFIWEHYSLQTNKTIKQFNLRENVRDIQSADPTSIYIGNSTEALDLHINGLAACVLWRLATTFQLFIECEFAEFNARASSFAHINAMWLMVIITIDGTERQISFGPATNYYYYNSLIN